MAKKKTKSRATPCWKEKLRNVLYQDGYCTSLEEADAVLDCVVEDCVAIDTDFGGLKQQHANTVVGSSQIRQSLQSALAVTATDAERIWRQCCPEETDDTVCEKTDDMTSEDSTNEDTDFLPDQDEEDLVGPGECELCERNDKTVKLTRHHLIPRSVWPRLESRLLNAFREIQKVSDSCSAEEEHWNRAVTMVGEGLAHLLLSLDQKIIDRKEPDARMLVRHALQQTCIVCRQCHRAIHRKYKNMVLATHYNTIDKLLQDETIFQFAKWASKQKRGSGK